MVQQWEEKKNRASDRGVGGIRSWKYLLQTAGNTTFFLSALLPGLVLINLITSQKRRNTWSVNQGDR